MAFGLLMALPLTAGAREIYETGRYGRDGYGRDGYGRNGGSPQRIGYAQGYEEGFDEGRKDAERGRGFSVRRHDEFRDGDRGYRREYGPRHLYVDGFRSGFEEGYRDAYQSRYGRYGRDRYGDRYGRYGRDRYGRDGRIYEDPRY